MNIIHKILAAAAVSAIALLPAIGSAAISPGTALSGQMDQDITSANASVGQGFTISNVHSADNKITGATIYGHVSSVQKAGQGTPGKIELQVDRVHTRAGNDYQVQGYVSDAKVVTKSNATKEAVAGLAGAVISSVLMRKNPYAFVLGAAGGYLYAKNNRENVTIPQGSALTIKVSVARRQATHP